MTDQWAPDVRPVIPELEKNFEHDTFPPAPTRFADWTEQLETSEFETLYANGGVGNPSIELGTD